MVHDFKILDFSNFSDHAPIYFTFLTKIISNDPTNNDTKSKFEQKIVFDEEKIAEYKETLKQNLDDLNSCIISETSVNMHAETLTNFLHENAIKTFGKNIPIKTETHSLLKHQSGLTQTVTELNKNSKQHGISFTGTEL